MSDLLLTNVRPMGGSATSLLIRNGRIEGFGLTADEPALPRLAGEGRIVLPGLVAHTHLDKSLLGLRGTATRSARV